MLNGCNCNIKGWARRPLLAVEELPAPYLLSLWTDLWMDIDKLNAFVKCPERSRKRWQCDGVDAASSRRNQTRCCITEVNISFRSQERSYVNEKKGLPNRETMSLSSAYVTMTQTLTMTRRWYCMYHTVMGSGAPQLWITSTSLQVCI